MSNGFTDRSTIRLSILDRLIDSNPGQIAEIPPDDGEKLRMIQQAVRRDLEALLNTRYRCVSWPPEFAEIDESLINYGIPDFTAASINAAEDSDVLIEAIQKAIRLFETRLVDVRVNPIANEHYYERTFRFRIEGMLLVEDAKHLIKFDSAMESATGQFEIK